MSDEGCRDLCRDEYTPVDRNGNSTGEREFVKGTALDFRSPRTIGDRINEAPGGGEFPVLQCLTG